MKRFSSPSARILFSWLLFTAVIQLAFQAQGGTNARSRGATLVALVEEGTFAIDSYLNLTVDWAQTPDGHYYSNKAPGPVFLALPFFWAMDRVQTWGLTERVERDQVREVALNGNLRALALLLQLLPFLLVVALWFRYLEKKKVEERALVYFLCAVCFANTAAVFLNSFFGHGLAAVWMLLLLLAICERRYALAGFSFGWAVLCDYGAAVYAVPLAAVAILDSWNRRQFGVNLRQLALGALVPAALWTWYHTSLFGGPLSLPYRYQNPVFVDMAHQSVQLWGVLGLPSLKIIGELLFGSYRGVEWSQPWILIWMGVLLAAPSTWQRPVIARDATWIVLAGFFLLLIMNASFGGWHGGASAGPRYLAVGLVLFAPLYGMLEGKQTPRIRRLLQILIALSGVMALVFLSVYELPREDMALWAFYADRLTGIHWQTPALRLAVSIPWMGWLLLRKG